jgi:hypothetical protein
MKEGVSLSPDGDRISSYMALMSCVEEERKMKEEGMNNECNEMRHIDMRLRIVRGAHVTEQ